MKPNRHVHTGGDGRGARDVFLDGTLINDVMYADTKRGIVRITTRPIRLDRFGKRVITKTLRGTVEVKFKHREPK